MKPINSSPNLRILLRPQYLILILCFVAILVISFFAGEKKKSEMELKERHRAEEQKAQLAVQQEKFKQDEAQKIEQAKEKEIVRESAERAAFVIRHLRTTNSLKGNGIQAIAIGVANLKARSDDSFATQLAGQLKSDSVNVGLPFTLEFATDGVLQKILRSSGDDLSRLNLAALADHLLLGDYRVEYRTNEALGNVITADIHFDGGVVRTSDGLLLEAFDFNMSGADFTNDRAEATAKQNLLKIITNRKWLFLKSK